MRVRVRVRSRVTVGQTHMTDMHVLLGNGGVWVRVKG